MQRGRAEGYMVDQGAQAKQGEARTQWGCRDAISLSSDEG